MSAAVNPLDVQHPLQAGKCHARSKRSGKQCGRDCTPGTTVCHYHGGAAPQVIAAARLRLLLAADPAAALIVSQMKNSKLDARERRAAAIEILNRAGLKADADLVQARVQAIQATVQASTPDGGSVISEIKITLVDGVQQAQHVNGKVNGHGD